MKITDIKVHYIEIPFPRELRSTWGHGRAEKVHGQTLVEVQTDRNLGLRGRRGHVGLGGSA